MKSFFNLLLVLGLASTAAQAQSTMPAIGANTPKGEVAKTDASINSTTTTKRTNASSKTKTSSGKRMGKTKMMRTKTTDAM